MATAPEAKIDSAKAEAAAAKAYAEAAAAPAKTETEVKPAPVAAPVVAPVVARATAKPVAAKVGQAAKKAAVKKITKKASAKPVAAKKTVKTAATKKVAKVAKTTASFKDTIMTKTTIAAEDFTAKVKDALTEAQDRAKLAFEKSQALAGEATEFTKGNVEALVASGKILAAGVQDFGKDYVAEAKTALETVQADMKDFAAVKSPTDFFKLQGEILRRNFDAAVASGSKNSEKVVKIAGDAFAPIQDRVAKAMEMVKKAA